MAKKTSEESAPNSGGTLMIMIMFAVMFFGMKYFLFPNKEEQTDSAQQSQAVGKMLKDIQLSPLTGEAKPIGLAELKGKVTLINYWGFWCPPCRVEFPHLVEIAKDFEADKDFQFVSVSTSNNPEPGDETEITEATTEFLKSQGATFPTYCDPWHKSKTFLAESASMEGFGYPTTVLIDRSGTIQGLWTGYKPGLEKEIAMTIAKELRNSGSAPAEGAKEKPAEKAAEKEAEKSSEPAAEKSAETPAEKAPEKAAEPAATEKPAEAAAEPAK